MSDYEQVIRILIKLKYTMVCMDKYDDRKIDIILNRICRCLNKLKGLDGLCAYIVVFG
jgi:hypothetical protein